MYWQASCMCAYVKDTVVLSKTKMEIKINKNSNIERKFVIYLITFFLSFYLNPSFTDPCT